MIKLEAFRGLQPRLSDRLLPPMGATVARNTKLLSGEIRGINELVLEADFTSGNVSPVKRAFRVPGDPDVFLTFDSQNVDVVRSPLVNDEDDRYYIAGDGVPKMNTADRIRNDDPAFFLGVPTPSTAPTVTPPAGSDETRAYVYTYVSEYGEEGPPSPPTLATGNAGQWAISNMDTVPPDQNDRNITKKHIYRTVVGFASTSFFFVAEVPVGDASYNDNETSSTVASNNLLESTSFIPPPSDMEGFVVMPNGYLVGWVGRRLLFSEPYRPHAWPAEYELSTEFDIVALAVFGSTCVITTESTPYFGRGVNPASFTTQKVDAIEPCLSRRGVVSSRVGVYYPSPNGIILANSTGVQLVTTDLFTKDDWEDYNPENIIAAQLGMQYIAFNSSSFGFIFDPENPESRFIELDAFTNVAGIDTDRYSGDVLIFSENKAYKWDIEGQAKVQWRWKSKTIQFPEPVNFGAARLNFVTLEDGGFRAPTEATALKTAALEAYNDALFAASRNLNTLNGGVLGGSPAQSVGLIADPPQAETRQPLGGSLLYPIQEINFQSPSVRVIISVRSKVVFDKQITTENIFRLPTGFKSDIWEIELNGNTDVYSLQIAETPKLLANV